MSGSVYKRCSCTGADGKLLGAACPRLASRTHGAWAYRAYLPLGPGGRRRRAGEGGFATRKEAEVALTALMNRVHERTHVDRVAQTVSEYLEDWLAGKAGLRSTTAKSYREHLDLYLKPVLGHIKLTDLTERHIEGLFVAVRLLGMPGVPLSSHPELEALLAARKSRQSVRPLSAASQRRLHATLRGALNAAVKKRVLAHNPALHLELPRGARPKAVVWNKERTAEWRRWRDRGTELRVAVVVAERRLRRASAKADRAPLQLAVECARAALEDHTASYRPPTVSVWTLAQTGQFLDAIEGHPLYALYHLIAFRGLRRGEAVGLPWSNVDLEAGFLTISTQVVQLGYTTERAAPKADSEGVVALDKGTVEALRAHKERQQRAAAGYPTVWCDTGLVFTRADGSGLHPELVSRTFDRLVRDADLPPIRLHDLRHGAATMALAGGVDLKLVSAMLRHSSITITADTYTSVLPETALAAAEAAAAMVPRRPTRSGA